VLTFKKKVLSPDIDGIVCIKFSFSKGCETFSCDAPNWSHSFMQTIAILFLLDSLFSDSFCFCKQAESAIVALNCSGMVLGSQPVRYHHCTWSEFCFQRIWAKPVPTSLKCFKFFRVSPSKTPVRPRVTRLALH
jgi:hypothetical protein